MRPRIRWSPCPTTGKDKYPSVEKCQAAVRRRSMASYCYRCPDCGFYHLTRASAGGHNIPANAAAVAASEAAAA